MKSFLLFFILFFAWNPSPCEALDEWEISYISPHRGGLNGGTQLTVYGHGFDTSLTFNSSNPTKRLYLSSDYRSYECHINIAASDEDQVVCETEAMVQDDYFVRMIQNGVPLPSNKYCGGNNRINACRFSVYNWRTPSFNELSWRTGETGRLLTISGRIYTNKTSSSVVAATNGITAAIQRVYVGDANCNLFNQTNDNEPFGASLEGEEGESHHGNLMCLVNDTFVGSRNVSFIVNEDFGRSLADRKMFLLSADNQLYNLQTYAVVTDVNPKQGSTVGGTELTIEGRGFYNETFAEAKVYVGGVVCDITEVTEKQIKCTTRPQPDSEVVYSGGRGMIVEVFYDTDDLSAALNSSAADRKFFIDNTNTTDDDFANEDNFVSRCRGFFIPAMDGDYQFIIKGDNGLELHVNPNGKDPAGANEVTSTTGRNIYAYSRHLTMKAGTEYYYEVRHQDTSSSANFQLDVYTDKTLYTRLQTSLSITERQKVEISAPVVKETQTVVFKDWSSESAVESVWSLQLSCQVASCEGYGFSFRLFEANSGIIEYSSDMTSSSIQLELNQLVVLGSDMVEVTGSNNLFTITFRSSKGHMPLEGVAYNSDLQMSLTPTTIGKPSLESFTFMVNGKVSQPVEHDASEDDVGAAVKSLFGPICPPQVESGIGSNRQIYYDMEKGMKPSGTISSEASYCGSFSVKNPNYLFNDAENSYRALSNPHLCFAYNGSLSSTVRVKFAYYEFDEGRITIHNEDTRLSFPDEIIPTTQWRHVCLNLFWQISAVAEDGFSLEVELIQVYPINGDVYLDNIFIGESSFATDELQIYARQIVPAAVSHIKLESVEVEKTGNSYVITYSPFDCGFDFPLLGIAFGNMKAGSTSNFVEYKIGEGSATVQVHRNSSASLPVTGSFDLGFDDAEFQTLIKVPANISELELRDRFQKLIKIHDVEVTRSGSCSGYSWEIQFISPGGNYPDLTTDGGSLSTAPGPVTITPTTLTNGGLRMGPVYGDFLRTAHDVPQVQVFIQDIPSACIGSEEPMNFDSCDFQWTEEATPTVTDLSTTEISSGDTFTITGTGFDPNPSSNIIIIGGVKGTVTSSSTTSITVVAGNSAPGIHAFELFVEGKGKAKISINNSNRRKTSTDASWINVFHHPSPNDLEYTLVDGDVVLKFPQLDHDQYHDDQFLIMVGGKLCDPLACNEDLVTCLIPPGSGTVEITIEWSDGFLSTVTDLFTYTPPTCSISSATPSALKVNGGETVTITGDGFGTVQKNVIVGCKTVEIITWKNDAIVFTSPSLEPGSYQVLVYTESSVCDPSNFRLDYQFEITSISPDTGSIAGGTEVTLTGIGLVENMTVTLDGRDYLVTNVSEEGTQGTFFTGPSKETIQIKNDGGHPEFGKGYQWNPFSVQAEVGQKITFSWSQQNFLDSAFDIDIFTSSPSKFTPDGQGFQVSGSKTGTYTVSLNVPGKYFYTSKCLVAEEELCKLQIYGWIEVNPSTEKSAELSASFGKIDAAIQDSSKFFNFDPESTPQLSQISSNTGYVEDDITITGSKLGSVVEVLIGENSITELDVTDTEVRFTLKETYEIETGINYEVSVRTNEGFAIWTQLPVEKRHFRLLPKVISISPICGSLEGETSITIEGFGFDTGRLNSIPQCDETDATYRTITCKTKPQINEGSKEIEIKIGDDKAMCSATTCEFAYAKSCTPEVDEITYSTTTPLKIIVKGSKFDSEESDIELILVGDFASLQASILSVNDTRIEARVTKFHPAGKYLPVLTHRQKGLAKFNGQNEYVKNFTLYEVNPNTGSIAGGQVVTLTGNGFAKDFTKVFIGSASCVISSLSDESLTCEIEETSFESEDAITVMVTVELGSESYQTPISYSYAPSSTPTVTSIQPNEGSAGDTVTLSGDFFTNEADDFQIKFDDVPCIVRTASESSVTCTLGQREAGTITPQVRVKGYGLATNTNEFTYNLGLQSVSPTRGSYGGGQTITLQGKGFSENMEVTICDKKCELVSGSMTSTQAECITPAIELDPSSTTISCNVKVSLNNLESTRTDEYTYDPDLTCVVTSVTPDRGGTGGGTEITITGEKFNDVTVSIDGSDCDVTSESETQIVCTTNSHTGSIKTPVRVACGSEGDAVTGDTYFFYADRWSSRFTWGGNEPPKEGSFVIIPKEHTLIIDQTTPILKMLLIDGGEVIFDNLLTEDGTTLNAENILIVNNGTLQIGTEEEPYLKKAEIVMHGNLRSIELPIYGAKTLGVREGKLDLHGKPVTMQWTMLSQTANAETTQIILEHPVDWNVGDQIVIASTGTRHSQEENEERNITAISVDKRTLTLDKGLNFAHLGIRQTHCDTDIQYRAEVGLLTRNIVFRGSDDLQWHDNIPKCEAGFNTGQFATQTCFQGRFGEEVGSDEFGASIMIHSQSPNTADKQFITARIENIEVTYAGQAFRLGRYPIHWHLMGDMSNSYVRSCAIHRTFNRAVTIHGTHNLLVEHNVVYNIMGGAIFIEDGIETGNIIQYNLAIFVRQSTSLLTEDITPAAYWVTNPDNIIRHNHGAGGTHFCFWYRMNEHPDGPSFTPNVCQQGVELGEFQNNTCHSQGWFGLWIFPTYFPVEGGSCGATTPTPAKFYSLTAWHCEKGAEWVNCGAIHFIDFVLADHEVAGMDLKLVSNVAIEEKQGALVENAAIIGHTDIHSEIESEYAIILPFSGGTHFNKICLENFNRRGAGFRLTEIQGTCTFLCGGFEMYFKQISYKNVEKRVRFRWEHEAVLIDEDGTFLDETPGSSLVPHTNIMDPNVCQIQTGNRYSSQVTAAICDQTASFIRMGLNSVLPSSLESKLLIVNNTHGSASSIYAKKRLTHPFGWMMLLQSKKEYLLHWDNGDQFTNLTYQATFYNFRQDDFITISHVFPQTIDRANITGGNGSEVDSIETSTNGDYTYDPETKKLSYRIKFVPSEEKEKPSGFEPFSCTNRGSVQHYSVNPKFTRCAVAGCEAPSVTSQVPMDPENVTKVLWSNTTSSCTQDRCRIPRNDTNSNICWVILDQNSTNCDNFIIEGILEVDETKDLTILRAKTIFIKGGRLIAGTPDKHFDKNFHIILTGNHTSEGFALDVAELGQKALGVLGGLDLHGKPHNVYWTRLEQTANVGATTIHLEEKVDWEVGNEIVITTTGYRSQETEKRKIERIENDGKTIVLDKALDYRHLGESYTLEDQSYSLKAEVGLLTRNIRIIGEEYDEIDDEAFGARVLVAGGIQEGSVYSGWARVSNVEFHRTGQEGWTEPYDPRFSLVWLNTGRASDSNPSYAIANAFHDGYSTAIGTFGADGIEIRDNVVHRTIHDGIRITGKNHVLKRNLVTMSLFRGSWGDRFERRNFKDWHASFEISQAEDITLEGNVAAGSERIGFHTDGEACTAPDSSAWKDNVAHGCLHGLHIFINDGVGDCSILRNFLVYKSWDYGVYFQTPVSVVVQNTTVVDSVVSFFSIVIGPPSLTHVSEDKCIKYKDVSCVGRSNSFDPHHDFMDESTDKNLRIRSAGPDRKAPRNPTGGSTCIILPFFASKLNGAPFKGFHFQNNYPAISGSFSIDGLYATNYTTENGKKNLVFWTSPKNEDNSPPIVLANTTLKDVEVNNKVLIDFPSLGKVNPSDCVDMECDAKKKVLIKDLDGSFLGKSGAIISQSEAAWDGDLRRGIGDYRIPETFLTSPEGERIPVDEAIDHRGIIRTPNCVLNQEWQAYNCSGDGTLDYRMLVIESMDDDTETRRLSPVAVIGDKYIDLINGPSDHGWCFGYTCQLRISTFWAIVANNKNFEIYFTGYAPRHLRLRLLRSGTCSANGIDGLEQTPDIAIRVAIFYVRPERLDIRLPEESNSYIPPRNSEKNGKDLVLTSNQEIPDLDPKGVHGDNYFDIHTRLQYVLLTEEGPVDLTTAPAVYIKVGLAAVTIDDFFGEKIRFNLASFLGVPEENIHIVDVIRETSRKRRDLSPENVEYILMYTTTITDDPSIDSNDLVAIETLNNGSRALIIAMQSNLLSEAINGTITSFSATLIDRNNTGEVLDDFNVVYNIPTSLSVSSLPSSVEEYMEFPEIVTATLLDANQNPVATLDDVFEVTVTLDKSINGADPNAVLLGDTSVMFTNGSATFTNLMISHQGTYKLNFQVTKPVNVLLNATNVPSLVVTQRTVNLGFASLVPNYINHGQDIAITLQLLNSAFQPLQNISLKGHTWMLEVSFDDSSIYNARFGQTTTFTFDNANGTVVTNGLQLIDTTSFMRYNLRWRAYTVPELYDIDIYSEPITFVNENEISGSLPKMYTVTALLLGDFNLVQSSSSPPYTFVTFLNNKMVERLDINTARVSDTNGNVTSDGNMRVSFVVQAANDEEGESALQALAELFIDGPDVLTYEGIKMTFADPACGIEVDSVCRNAVATPGTVLTVAPTAVEAGTETWIFIAVGIVVALILAALIIAFACVMKRAKVNKIGLIRGNCLDADSSRGSTPLMDSFSGSTLINTPGPGSQFGDYPEWGRGITPVRS